MSVQYEQNIVLTPATTTAVFTLKSHPRGLLEKFLIKQTAGALDGYSFDLLSIHPDDLPAGHSIDTYKIVATQTVAGAAASKEMFNVGANYRNQKDTTVPTGAIYLKFNITTNVTSKTFQVGYVTSNDLGT